MSDQSNITLLYPDRLPTPDPESAQACAQFQALHDELSNVLARVDAMGDSGQLDRCRLDQLRAFTDLLEQFAERFGTFCWIRSQRLGAVSDPDGGNR